MNQTPHNMKSLSEIWISNSGELVQNKIIILQLTTQPIYILTLISSPQALTITTDQTAVIWWLKK